MCVESRVSRLYSDSVPLTIYILGHPVTLDFTGFFEGVSRLSRFFPTRFLM